MIQLRIPFSLRNPFLQIFEDYQKRLRWKFSVTTRKPNDLLSGISKDDFVIVLDIFGEDLKSEEFAELFESKLQTYKNIIFIIGGDTGLDEKTRAAANLKISFGKNTWPHQLCALMLIEQIYRAETIVNRHPYHK